MPLQNYGVLKATPVDRRLATGDSPHYQILAVDDQDRYRLAVNVKSQESPSEVAYLIVTGFKHPLTALLESLQPGWHPLPSQAGGEALDYIRGNLFRSFADFMPLPLSVVGPDNDLNEKIDRYVQRAMASVNAWVYAFGEPWGPETTRDKIFGFSPGRGVHDIHMNQGNSKQFAKDDGVWQDGGLLFWYPAQQEWVAIFLRFQSQAIHTDDATGHATPADAGGAPPSVPSPTAPDGIVRIVAAQVNTIGDEANETVILINTTPQPINLDGWKLLDTQKHQKPLGGVLKPGEPLVVHVRPEVQLSNTGGIISLVNGNNIKIDGVSYTREQASVEGRTIVF